MRILLTGGRGMVGQAIRTGLDARARPDELLAPTRAELDLLDAGAVAAYLARHRPEVVVHAAGRVGGIADNIADPDGYLRDNTMLALNVIGGALDAGVPRLLNLGSSCMYPKDWRQPLVEDDLFAGPLEPTNEGYALAKLTAERLCTYASQRDGVVYRTLIPSNLYGPGDHFDLGRAHLVAAAVAKVDAAKRSGSATVTVWGDGTARREFTFVADVAAWVVDVLPRLDGLPQTLNVGCGTDHSVREYYEAVAGIAGYGGALEYDAKRPVGMRQKLMDSSLAAGHGWTAPTSLSDGIRRTYEWYLEHVSADASTEARR